MAADTREHIPSQGRKMVEGSIPGTLPVVPFYLENENYPRTTPAPGQPSCVSLASIRSSGHS